METLTRTEFDYKTEKLAEENTQGKDVLVIVLLVKNFDFAATRTPYDIDICGKKMWEWVALAGDGYRVRTTVCTEESNILTLIKPYLDDSCAYTAVLYSDTPLFEKNTFNKIMQFVRAKQVNVLNLKRGYVFNTEYIKNADNFSALPIYDFGEKDFYRVSKMQDIDFVRQTLSKKINEFHQNNGVILIDKNTTYIDCDVIIESGTKIGPNNTLLGQTYIGKNCVLEPNNVISNSVISDNCIIKCSYISESRISENIVVGPFESVIEKSI
ncbi:MAG: hypothetical protein IJA69_03300 [Clostridia bacterium]|nr:hypothetical protein [Clostridia bacterium]